MASLTPTFTDEEKNFYKFLILNTKVSPPIVRTYFDSIFPPATLAQTLNQNMNIIQSLIGRKRITLAHEAILRSIPGTVWKHVNPAITHGPTAPTSSSDFDLTLMICLMRNIGTVLGLVTPPSTGWDKLPNRNDKSVEAFLARIKFCRNELAHSSVSKMSNSDFKDKWFCIEEALTYLNGQKPVPGIGDILNLDMDGQNETLSTEMKNLKAAAEQLRNEFDHYKTGNLPRNIAENMEKLMKVWEKDDETYFETSRCEELIKMLTSKGHVTVTGSSGSGKSALVRHAALHLQNTEEFSIILVEDPEHIIQYKTNGKQIFIVDDVFGKYSINLNLLDKWERNKEKLNVCLKSKDTKIVCTLRTHVARTREFKSANSFLNKNEFDLEIPLRLLSNNEKRQIFMKHLDNSKISRRDRNISEEDIKQICTSTFAFPLLCKLVTSDSERFKARLQFFDHPSQLFKSELDKLSSYNPVIYCALVICMIFTGHLNRSDLYSKKHKDLIHALIEGCGLKDVTQQCILESLEKAVGTYIVRKGNEFKFIHDKLFESVSSHFANYNTRLMLEVCEFEFIRDRVRIGLELPEDDESVVLLDSSSVDIISQRMFHELQNGNFATVLLSLVVNNDDVVEELCKLIANHSSYFNVLRSKERSEKGSTKGFLTRIKNFISNNRVPSLNQSAILRVMEFPKHNRILIYWLVAFSCDTLLKKMWNTINKCQRRWLLGRDLVLLYSKPLFPLSILAGNMDIVDLFLPYADVNCYSELGETPLSIAIMTKRLDIAKILLHKGASINRPEMFRRSFPLIKSVETDDIDIIDFLVEKKVDVDSCDILGNSFMSEILVKKSPHFLRNLLQKFAQNGRLKQYIFKVNLNNDKHKLDDSDNSLLKNFADRVEDLVKAIMNNDEERVEDLLKATLNNDEDRVEDLVKDLNNFCFIGLTLIQFAAALDFTNIAKLILVKGCQKTNGEINISPLHIAVNNDNIELVDVCLKYDAFGLDRIDLFGKTPFHYVKSIEMVNALKKFIKTRAKKNLRTEIKTKTILPVNKKSNILSDLESSTDADRIRIQDHESQDCHSHNEPSFGAVVKNVYSNVLYFFYITLINLQNGAPVNKRDYEGNTVLHNVAQNKNAIDKNRLTETILKSGGNKYLRNWDGNLPYGLLDEDKQSTSLLKPTAKYMNSEQVIMLLSFVIGILISFCSFYFNFERYKSLLNNQQKCLLEEMSPCTSKCNETLTRLNAVQDITSYYIFEDIISVLLFLIVWLFQCRSVLFMRNFGKQEIIYFTFFQILKSFIYFFFILGIDDSVLRVYLIYAYIADFKCVSLFKKPNLHPMFKYFLLLIILYIYIMFIVISIICLNTSDNISTITFKTPLTGYSESEYYIQKNMSSICTGDLSKNAVFINKSFYSVLSSLCAYIGIYLSFNFIFGYCRYITYPNLSIYHKISNIFVAEISDF